MSTGVSVLCWHAAHVANVLSFCVENEGKYLYFDNTFHEAFCFSGADPEFFPGVRNPDLKIPTPPPEIQRQKGSRVVMGENKSL